MTHHLAQLNVGRLLAPLDTPAMAEFVAQLGPVNALADAAPGFVWRLHAEGGYATVGADLLIVNLSVWENADTLHDYVYGAGHIEVMRRRREWFARLSEAFVVLWWIPEGHLPTVDEAMERLAYLRANGATERAFTLRQRFDAEPAPVRGE